MEIPLECLSMAYRTLSHNFPYPADSHELTDTTRELVFETPIS